jgi:SPP1 family predicted phage head-tail adaptor
VQAGRLDRLITLQTRVLTRNAQGEEVVSYTDLADVWASKVDLRGREYFAAQQVNAEVTTRWQIYYRSDITYLHAVVYDGVTYDIQQVSEIGRRIGLELMTVARET